MKNCTDCKYADWQRSKPGKLHPHGAGKCTYDYAAPELPAGRHWAVDPVYSSGDINQHEDFRDHCPYYTTESKEEKGEMKVLFSTTVGDDIPVTVEGDYSLPDPDVGYQGQFDISTVWIDTDESHTPINSILPLSTYQRIEEEGVVHAVKTIREDECDYNEQ